MANTVDFEKTVRVLRKISSFLKSNDVCSIEAEILGFGFENIISERGVGLARAIRDPRLVIFLLSLARENEIKFDGLDHWYGIYQSINSRDINCCACDDSTRSVVDVILNDVSISEFSLRDFLSKPVDVRNLELLVDFKKWEILLSVLNDLPVDGSGLRVWLNFIKIIVHRQRFVVLSVDGKSFSEIYRLILDKLNHLSEIRKSLSAIKLIYAGSLQMAGEIASALKVYELCDDYDHQEIVSLEKARCKSKLGQYDKSLCELDNLIGFLIEADEIGKSVPFLLQTPADLNYSGDSAIKAYSDIAMLAEVAGAELFMVSGTLLGYCRLGDFLPNDKDLDFGLIGLNKLPGLVDLAIKSGLFQINPIYLKGEDTIQVPFIHVPTGVWIDVFIYHEDNGFFVTGVDFQFGYRQKFKFSKFSPVPVDFHGIKTFVPSNRYENLRENFLDWEISDPNYISHVESPSVFNFGDSGHRMSSRLWAVRAIQSKSAEKLKKIVGVISKMGLSEDAALIEKLISAIGRFENKAKNLIGA